MNKLEFDLATIAQEPQILSVMRRTSPDEWHYVARPSIARIATLCNLLVSEQQGKVRRQLSGLATAVTLLKPPNHGEVAGLGPHSSDEAWQQVRASVLEIRRAFGGKVADWVLPS